MHNLRSARGERLLGIVERCGHYGGLAQSPRHLAQAEAGSRLRVEMPGVVPFPINDRVRSVHVMKANAIDAAPGKSLRLAKSTLLQGKERDEMEEAYAGDVIGLFDRSEIGAPG